MAQVLSISGPLTVVDLADLFDPIPAGRIRSHPAPGTATEQDIIDLDARSERLCELFAEWPDRRPRKPKK
jgi:hypothetical protein